MYNRFYDINNTKDITITNETALYANWCRANTTKGIPTWNTNRFSTFVDSQCNCFNDANAWSASRKLASTNSQMKTSLKPYCSVQTPALQTRLIHEWMDQCDSKGGNSCGEFSPLYKNPEKGCWKLPTTNRVEAMFDNMQTNALCGFQANLDRYPEFPTCLNVKSNTQWTLEQTLPISQILKRNNTEEVTW